MTSNTADKGTVLVTGAARGLGRALADLYAAAGFRVIACTRQGAGEPLDVADAASIAALGERLQGRPIDVVINNAGILDNLLPIAEMPDDVWERIMNINLNSVMYACRKAVQYFLKEKREGTIINTASLSGLCAGRGGLAYTTSKFAVVGLTKNVAFMYSDAGIRCNALCPGAIESNIGSGMREPSKLGLTKAVTGNSGRHRNGSADEVATAAVFLASDAASFINGETLTIDGGWSAY